MPEKIAEVKIIDNNESYLINDSILPVYVDECG